MQRTRELAVHAILCAASFLILACFPTFRPAGTALAAEATILDVTVPAGFPVQIHADGSATTASNTQIMNSSDIPVCVREITITGQNGWTLADFDTVKAQELNSRLFGWEMTIDGQTMKTNGNSISNTEILLAEDSTDVITIPAGEAAAITYDAAIPAVSKDISSGTAAIVIFTVTPESSDSEQPEDPDAPHAILYEDGTMVFQMGSETGNQHGNVLGKYSGFDTETYGSRREVPWHQYMSFIKSVSFQDTIFPVSTAYWFDGADSLKSYAFVNSSWSPTLCTDNVQDMTRMFAGCSSLISLDLWSFNTRNASDMREMFADCSSLTSLSISSFSTGEVTDMSGMFSGCSSLKSLGVWSFDVSQVTNMSNMFSGCSSLRELGFWSSASSNVTDMSGMFKDCSSLKEITLSSLDTRSVENMSEMFSGCSSFTSLGLWGFVTDNVTDMSEMFFGCSSLTLLDFEDYNGYRFHTGNVTDMHGMFADCFSLTGIKGKDYITDFPMEVNADDISSMFSNCYSLKTLDMREFDLWNVTDSDDLFANCDSVTITVNSSEEAEWLLDTYGFPQTARVIYDSGTSSQTLSLKQENAAAGNPAAAPTVTAPVLPEEELPAVPEEVLPDDAEGELPGDAEEELPGDADGELPGDTEEELPGDAEEELPGDAEEELPGDAEEELPTDPEENPEEVPEESPGGTPETPDEEVSGETPSEPSEESPESPEEAPSGSDESLSGFADEML